MLERVLSAASNIRKGLAPNECVVIDCENSSEAIFVERHLRCVTEQAGGCSVERHDYQVSVFPDSL